METLIIGNPPRGKLRRAEGHNNAQCVFSFGPRDLRTEVKDKYYSYLRGLFKQAVLHPGVRVVRYSEENGYEYETYAVYDPEKNTITSNDIRCPSVYWHHLGSTCSVCGQKD